MNRTRYIPALVTLLAALVVCVAMYVYKYSTREIMINVFITCIVFLIIGSVIRRIAEKFLVIETVTETELENQEEGENQEEKKDGEDSKEQL